MFIHHNTTIALMMFSWTAHFTRYTFNLVAMVITQPLIGYFITIMGVDVLLGICCFKIIENKIGVVFSFLFLYFFF